jgi:hypothetical protein
MIPIRRLLSRRAARNDDRRVVAKAQEQMLRAGDEPTRPQEETVDDAAGRFPSAL